MGWLCPSASESAREAVACSDAGTRDRLPRRRSRCVGNGLHRHAGRTHGRRDHAGRPASSAGRTLARRLSVRAPNQPSAYYGVESRQLGNNRIDEHGPNAGFYERASAPEICDYYLRVLDEHLLPTGRVRFVGTSEYHGNNGDGHLVTSLLDGSEILVKPRRKVVDATYVQSEIPSRHVPGFTVEPGVALVPPNDLVDLGEPADRFTVIGAGKTGMDTCVWLLEAGVDPERIRWIRARDPWQYDRNFMQPLDLVGSESCGFGRAGSRRLRRPRTDVTSRGASRRLECSCGSTPRSSPGVSQRHRQPTRDRRSPHDRARRAGEPGAEHRPDDGHDRRGRLPGGPREVYVDCTAAGLRPTVARPVFEPGRITIQYVNTGLIPWCAPRSRSSSRPASTTRR